VDARDREFPNAQRFSFEGLHGRSWSSSYVFRGVEDREGFVLFPYRAVGLVFRVARTASGA
jgi:hypothetical protein